MTAGRHPYQPTDDDRKRVKRLAALNVPLRDIAKRIINRQTTKPIGVDTLREYFADELEDGQLDLYITASDLYVKRVTGAPASFDEEGNKLRDEVLPSEAAQDRFLKIFGRKYGWDGAQDNPFANLDLSKLTDVELSTFKAIVAKARRTDLADD